MLSSVFDGWRVHDAVAAAMKSRAATKRPGYLDIVEVRLQSKCRREPSGPSTLIKDHLAGGASRLAALLLPQILPVFSVVAPCQPGAALRELVLVQRGQATSRKGPECWPSPRR